MNTLNNSYFITNTDTIFIRWYAGSRYIKETEGSTTKEYTWIGGDAYSAPIVAEKVGSTTNYYYLLRDYLGTITHILDASYNVVAEYSFDGMLNENLAFVSGSEIKALVELIPISAAVREGRRRDKDDWHYTLNGEPDLLAGRGFTAHENLGYFGLINMNGRLYDPIVGRFLSPDENVQLPDFTQNFNRYSYGLNNPLKFTDPDGEWFLSLFFPPLVVVDVFLWSATFDYATQVITNYVNKKSDETFSDWAWKDIDWLDVGVSGLAGVATMGLDKVYKAGKVGHNLYKIGEYGINYGLPAISARYDWKPASTKGDRFSVNRGDKFWSTYVFTAIKQNTATRYTNKAIGHWYSGQAWVLGNNPVKKQVIESFFDLPASVGSGWLSDKYYNATHIKPKQPQVPLLPLQPEETPLPEVWWENINNYSPIKQDMQSSLSLYKF